MGRINIFLFPFALMESTPSPIEQYVIDYVRKLRLAHKLTQADISVIIGTAKGFVGNVESLSYRAKYNLDHINAIADHFNISPGDLLPKKAFPVNMDTPKAITD